MTAHRTGVVGKVMGGLIGRAQEFESRLTDTVERASQHLTQSGHRQPLEVAHAIADAVERYAHVAGRGRRSFPAHDIRVTVVAANREAREQYAAVFEGAAPLRERIAERLDALGCGVETLAVNIAYAAHAKPGWMAPDFHVAFHRTDPTRSSTAATEVPHTAIELRIAEGAAEQDVYTWSQTRVDIGRCRDVRDTRQHLIRTNHVVFLDSADAVNQSVSRQHAHISVAGNGQVRLYDDGSVHGTSVVRSGRTVPVPLGTRGIRLLNGDAIRLGEARLEVKLS